MGGLERTDDERKRGQDEAQTVRPPQWTRPPGVMRTGDEILAEELIGCPLTTDAKPGRLRRSDLSEAGGLWVGCDYQSAHDIQSEGCSVRGW